MNIIGQKSSLQKVSQLNQKIKQLTSMVTGRKNGSIDPTHDHNPSYLLYEQAISKLVGERNNIFSIGSK